MSEELETQILLRSTGELSPEACAQLQQALASDAEAAAFAHFIDAQLPAAARSPQDFASIAIHRASQAFAGKAMQARAPWKHRRSAGIAGIAAVAACLAIVAGLHFMPSIPHEPLAIVPQDRVTVAITKQLDRIESELAPTANSRTRYRRTPPRT